MVWLAFLARVLAAGDGTSSPKKTRSGPGRWMEAFFLGFRERKPSDGWARSSARSGPNHQRSRGELRTRPVQLVLSRSAARDLY
jgi:hypothetical protein